MLRSNGRHQREGFAAMNPEFDISPEKASF
jgi:hypothetical protein